MSPLRDCLTEDPIQVMFTGYTNQVREVETFLAALPFASEYSIAMTVYTSATSASWTSSRRAAPKARPWPSGCGGAAGRREDVMAIGDNLNDMEMLQFAGLPVVMGNSVPELKSLGLA